MKTNKVIHTKKQLNDQTTRNTSFAIKYAYLIIILIPLLVYLPSVKNGFVYFDDDILILENQTKLTNTANIIEAFQSDAFFNKSSPYYRPLLTVSLILDAQVSKTNPGFYHFMNIIYHILSCIALFWFLGMLGFKKEISLLATLFFSVHPLMAGAVYWIPARNDLLVSFFSLLFLSFSIRYFQNQKFPYYIVSILAFTLAIFSKESGIILPLVLFSFLIYIKLLKFNKETLIYCLSLLLITAIWFFLRKSSIANVGMTQVGSWAILANYPFPFEIITKFIFPFDNPVTPVYSNSYTIIGILIFSISVLYVLFRKPKDINLIFFGFAWYLLFSLPNMFVRLDTSIDSYDYLTHRAYLPLVGLIIVLITIINKIFSDFNYRSVKGILLFLPLILLIASSISLANKYRNPTTFWTSSIERNPEKAWFHYFLGRSHFMKKNISKSEQYFRNANSLKQDPRFKYGLTLILQNKKLFDSAFLTISQARSLGLSEPGANTTYVNLCIETAKIYYEKGEYSKAAERCHLAVDLEPNNAILSYNMGLYLINAGETKKAASYWRRSINLDTEFKDAYRNLYYYYLNNSKMSDSTEYYLNQFTIRGGKL